MKKHDPVDGFTALMLAERVVAAAMGKTTCHLMIKSKWTSFILARYVFFLKRPHITFFPI
jgi:hypothetical protein